MWLGVLLLRYTLFTLKSSNHMTLAYKTMHTTHTNLDLGMPLYCFIIALNFAQKEMVGVLYLVLLWLASEKAIVSFSYTKRCVQLI